jgi:hypothetical protein
LSITRSFTVLETFGIGIPWISLIISKKRNQRFSSDLVVKWDYKSWGTDVFPTRVPGWVMQSNVMVERASRNVHTVSLRCWTGWSDSLENEKTHIN